MSFYCNICSLPFTNPNTDHSIYSTMCGHIVGKSCIEKLRSSKPFYNFKCPICCKKLGRMAYHPIFNIPYEISDIVINPVEKTLINNCDSMEWSIGNKKNEDSTFVLKFSENINGTIELFDVYNEFILINGFNPPNSENLQYVVLLKSKSKEVFFSRSIKSHTCTAIAFNKYKDDVIEFCIGSDKGELFHAIIGLNFKIILEEILIQENEKIDSICFLEKNKVAYSFGKGQVFVFNINNIIEKENWAKFKISEGGIITNLQKFTENIIIGKINNKLYIFENFKHSDELCHSYYSGDRELINYIVDSNCKIIIGLYNERNKTKDNITLVKPYISRKIKGVYFENSEYNKEIEYISFIIEDKNFPLSFKPKFIILKEEENSIIYTFIPNIKKKVIQAVILKNGNNNNTELSIVAEKFIENIDTCIGISIYKNPKIYLSKFMKAQLILFFKNKYILLNFICSLSDKER
uniref:RING-type domain-containing protein n=1 Tax=Strongyloides stercoralis TaxID=6248 RepID=A0A0K0EHH8_STRER